MTTKVSVDEDESVIMVLLWGCLWRRRRLRSNFGFEGSMTMPSALVEDKMSKYQNQ